MPPINSQYGNGLVLLIKAGRSIRLKWVNTPSPNATITDHWLTDNNKWKRQCNKSR